MLHMRALAALLAFLVSGVPALASVTVLHSLRHDELLGETSSRAEIQRRVAANEPLLAMAGTQMGLSRREFAQFLQKFKHSKPAWVTMPRHLDAMSGLRRSGKVYVIRNVVIPAGSTGWEVDLKESHQLVRLFMPASCGNLSVIRTPVHLAARPSLPPRHVVTAAATPPPPPTPAPTPTATPEAFPPPPHHNAGLFAFFGGLILLLIGSGGGPGPGPGPNPTPPPPCPPAPPVDAVQATDCTGTPSQ